MNLTTCFWSDATFPELPWCLDVAPLSSWCLFSRLYRLIPMPCANTLVVRHTFRPNKTKVMEECFQSATCVCVCVRACVCVKISQMLLTWWPLILRYRLSLLEFPSCSGGILSAGRGQCVHCVNSLK